MKSGKWILIISLGMLIAAGCGTTRESLPGTSQQSDAPQISLIEVVSNTTGTPDVIRSVVSSTLAVEPHSVIKIYDGFGAATAYTTTADSLGRFTLEIGDDVLDPVLLTATAPFKSESVARGFSNPF